MKRRLFLKKIGGTAALISAGNFPLQAIAEPEFMKLTILHTNDVHSRIEPFPMDGGKNAGLGGAAKRAGLINKIRSEEEHVLLFDCGDIFQGTPYFNKFGGELEFKLMSKMKYDATTLGNHDFDLGLEGLSKQFHLAEFPFLISNYDFSDTIIDGKTRPYKVFEKGEVRIGVFGIGIELDGLVPEKLYTGTRYLNPVEKANAVAAKLKQEEKCDYIVCLSHLGYSYDSNKISDIKLAEHSEYIDLILGGHTHTFLEKPDQVKNKAGKMVVINQAGWAGILLGRLDIYFERNLKRRCLTCKNLPII